MFQLFLSSAVPWISNAVSIVIDMKDWDQLDVISGMLGLIKVNGN